MFKLCTSCTTVQTEDAESEPEVREISHKKQRKPRNFRRWFRKHIFRNHIVAPEPFKDIDLPMPRVSVAKLNLAKVDGNETRPDLILRPVVSENKSIYDCKLPLEIRSDVSISTVSTLSMDLSTDEEEHFTDTEEIHASESRNLDRDTPFPGTPLSIEDWSPETDSEVNRHIIFVRPAQSETDFLQTKLREVAEKDKDNEVHTETEMPEDEVKPEDEVEAEDEVETEVEAETEVDAEDEVETKVQAEIKPHEEIDEAAEIVYEVRVCNKGFRDFNSMPEVPYRYEAFCHRGPRFFTLTTVSSVKHPNSMRRRKPRTKPLTLKVPAAHMYAVPAIAMLTEEEEERHHEWVQKAPGAGTKGEIPWHNQAISFKATFPDLKLKFRKRFRTPKDAVRVGAVPQIMQIQVLKLEEGQFPGRILDCATCDASWFKWNLDPDSTSEGSAIADRFRKFW